MFKYTTATLAILASAAMAAPTGTTTTATGPPVVYQTGPAAPLVTAVTLSGPAATASPKVRRDEVACYPQPSGISHKSSPDTAAVFRADSYYAQQALAAQTPIGFKSVFTNTNASSNAAQYMGYTLMDTYDVQSCAKQCNAIAGCSSFNVYFERDPSVNPNSDSCSNPSSTTQIKCVWWGSAISLDTNVNQGQWRNKFEVAIAGSNGYAGLPTQRGFRIVADGSGTEFDRNWLAVSPGEGAAVALNPVQYKAQSSIFQFGSKGELLQISSVTGMAAASPNKAGTWAALQYRAVGQSSVDYLKCSGDNLINCQAASGWQYAGVCPSLPANTRGLIYFGLPQNMPKDCKWIGIYIDTNITI